MDYCLKELMKYCKTPEFLNTYETFIRVHAERFGKSSKEEKTTAEDEHSLEWMKCFKEYSVIFENDLINFAETRGFSETELYSCLKDRQHNGTPEEKHFISLLVASADYEAFSKILINERKNRYFLNKWKRMKSAVEQDKAFSNAEFKKEEEEFELEIEDEVDEDEEESLAEKKFNHK